MCCLASRPRVSGSSLREGLGDVVVHRWLLWPDLALLAVVMIVGMVLMARMMGSMGARGMCGLGRWREARDRADADERTLGDHPRTDSETPD